MLHLNDNETYMTINNNKPIPTVILWNGDLVPPAGHSSTPSSQNLQTSLSVRNWQRMLLHSSLKNSDCFKAASQ